MLEVLEVADMCCLLAIHPLNGYQQNSITLFGSLLKHVDNFQDSRELWAKFIPVRGQCNVISFDFAASDL